MEIEKIVADDGDIKTEKEIFPTHKPIMRSHSFRFIVISFVAVTVLISALVGAVFGFMGANISKKIFPSETKLAASDQANVVKQQVVEEDTAVIDVVKKSSPAVVSIVISKDVPKMQDLFSSPSSPFGFFGGLDPFGSNNDGSNLIPQGDSGTGGTEKQTIGGGSGFLITSDGMIVTNKHVVSDPTADYTVITSDGKEHPAKVLATDPSQDIAVIKIDGQGYHTLALGDSDSLQIGQTVIAIGNSLGEFSNTVSKGIVSGLKRNLTASGDMGQSENLSNIIQTDAAINPGNSGGPLLDINGEVIGINVAMAQGAQSIGFAIPSNQIKKIINQVKTTGKITVPYLGVRYIPIDSQIKQQISNFSYDYGALVVRGDKITDFAVVPGSPADKAGITENDVILEVNGTKIDQNNSLGDLIAKYNVGDTVTLKVWHKGNIEDIKVQLAERTQ